MSKLLVFEKKRSINTYLRLRSEENCNKTENDSIFK